MNCKRGFIPIRLSVDSLALLFSLLVVASCAQQLQTSPPNEGALREYCASLSDVRISPNKALDIAKNLPKELPLADMENKLKEILPEIGRINRGQMHIIYEAILLLREHPFIVQALVNHYYSTPQENFQQRLLILKVVGELQRFDAFDFLREVVWAPLPAISPGPADRITAREYEEMIQSKAMQGLAYLKNEEGRPLTEAAQETIRVIKEHPSHAVRIASIDAYMWNHGDTKDAAATLYGILPEESHKYVERPRFQKGMNQKVFNLRLEEWRKKWAN